jgi:hypothetical protein
VSKKAQKQEQMQKDVYSECTFQPRINPTSDKIAPSLTSNDRHQNFEGQAKKEKLIQEAKAKQESECTFKPQVIAKKEYKDI